MSFYGDWRNLAIGILLLTSLLLGLAVVWFNLERLDLAYSLKEQQDALGVKTALVSKLEVERDNLLSPHVLRRHAKELGLRPASPGRIRRLENILQDGEPQHQERP